MAVARFNWELLTSGGGGQFFPNWQAEYFNTPNLSGSPVLIRDDATINNNWGLASPGPGVNADFWSVRWTRVFNVQPGQYRLQLSSDDGSRLFINNQLIVDNWRDQATTSAAVDYFTNGGSLTVRVDDAGVDPADKSLPPFAHVKWNKRQLKEGKHKRRLREERQSVQGRRSGRHTDIQQSGPLARAPIRSSMHVHSH